MRRCSRRSRRRTSMTLSASLVLIAALLLGACRSGEQPANRAVSGTAEAAAAPILTTSDALDTHSFARPLEARVTHVALDLNVDFDTKRIGGTATLDIDRRPGAKRSEERRVGKECRCRGAADQ